MKKRYLLLIIPIIVIITVLVLNKKTKNVSIKEAAYDSSYSKLAINVLKNKMNDESITNYEDGNKGEMYAFHHENTYQVSENTDYRYIGNNPNNYAYFNCSDINDTSTCEIWRIMGIFPFKNYNSGKFEYKIKIMRDEYIGEYAYDTNGITDWGRVTLKEYLNNEYFNSLSSSSQNMIVDVNYYLGPMGYEELVPYEEFYRRERNNYYNQTGNEYTGYSSSWTGKIALPYPSDYYYAGSWMHTTGNMALLNREEYILNGNLHYIINDTGSFFNSNPTTPNNIKPVAYLDNNLFITSGNGTEENPYLIMSKYDYMNQNYDYKIGDEVYYNNELYHVIDNSTEDSDYISVMKDVPLTQKYMPQDDINEIGFLPFDYGKKCFYKSKIYYDYSGCTSNFNESYINSFLDTWSNNEFDNSELVDVDGNKVRLITKDEIINGLKFEKRMGISEEYFIASDDTPDFIKNRDYSCWTMDQYEDSNRVITFNNNYFSNVPSYSTSCVDPVINFRKSSIGSQNEYSVGDIINYKGADYYVMNNSLSDIDYVIVLRVEPLSKGILSKYSNSNIESVNSNAIAYSQFMKSGNGLVTSYDNSDIKKYVDYWIDNNFDEDDLKEVNGYKGRLISLDELFEKFYYDYQTTSQGSSHYRELKATDNTPDWIYRYSFWTETNKEDNSQQVYVITNYGGVYAFPASSKSTIRPIIYLKKSAIGKTSSKYEEDEEIPKNIDNKITEKTCTPKYKKETIINYNTYNVGDEINYKGDKYYVIRNSDDSQNYVTILKDELLKNSVIVDSARIKKMIRSLIPENDQPEKSQFYKSDTCYDDNARIDCENTFNKSLIKPIIENWTKIETNEDDLIEVNGSKYGLLNLDELITNLGFTVDITPSSTFYLYSNDTPVWIKNFSYWIDAPSERKEYALYIQDYDHGNGPSIDYVFGLNYIRPVINLKKSALGDKIDYNIGDKVTYYENDYYVIENSDSTKDYIVLLKDIPFTKKQIEIYSDLDAIMNNLTENAYITSYYISESCNSNENMQECKNDYNSSNVKNDIDKWIKDNDIENDLIEVDGYKARLLNVEDLFENLNYTDEKFYNFSGEKNIYITNKNVPEWIYSPNEKYWTMISENSVIYIISENGFFGSQYISSDNYTYNVNVFDQYAIRPVLNLNKCAIEGGCTTEEIEIEDGCMEDGVTILENIANTLSSYSKYIIALSLIFIIIGCGVLGYNYYNSRKERK